LSRREKVIQSLLVAPTKKSSASALSKLVKLVDPRIERPHNGRMGWRGSVPKILVATLSVLLVGACSGESGNGGGTAQSQTPTPKAISVQEYGTTLAGAIDPLESALKNLAKAKAYKGLNGRVTAVETAAAKAVTKLSPITPPAELAGEHSQLVTALQAFHDELGGLSSKVGDRALCTGSAVRAGLGDADGTSTLRDALAAVSAKLPDVRPALTLPPAGQKGDARPSNGKLIRAGNGDGRGELTIDNGGSNDAVVTLSKGRKPAVSVYVRKNKKHTVKGVPDGTYAVFFTGGDAWDGTARAFGRNCAFQRFEDPMKFRTIRTATQIRWSVWTVTLQRVVGGTARTADVDPNDFPE
jgi:hypothetical protein